jgi:hypothetical protein
MVAKSLIVDRMVGRRGISVRGVTLPILAVAGVAGRFQLGAACKTGTVTLDAIALRLHRGLGVWHPLLDERVRTDAPRLGLVRAATIE